MRFIIVFFLWSFSSVVIAQSQRNWLAYFDNVKITDRFNLHNEIQHRNHDVRFNLEQLIVRNGVGFNLSEDNNNLLLGYAFIHNRPEEYCPEDKSLRFNEHRVYQQFISKQRFGHLFLTHRYRAEQRFFNDDFSLRMRYWLSAYISINKMEIKKGTVFTSFYNEIFMQTQYNYFDRNRIYGGLGYGLTDNIKIEVGVVRQVTNENRVNHFQISLFNYIAFKQHR